VEFNMHSKADRNQLNVTQKSRSDKN